MGSREKFVFEMCLVGSQMGSVELRRFAVHQISVITNGHVQNPSVLVVSVAVIAPPFPGPSHPIL